MFINGKKVQSESSTFYDVHNPATGELIARTPQCTPSELSNAAESCAEAFKTWRTTPVSTRARVMHKLEGAIRDNTDELAKVLTQEQGKTLADAKGDIFRGLEVVEMSCNIPAMIQGETLPNVANSVDVHSYRIPLGVLCWDCSLQLSCNDPTMDVPTSHHSGKYLPHEAF